MKDIEEGRNLVFRNSKNRLFKLKDFQPLEEELNNENYDEIHQTVDRTGTRTGTVFVKNSGQEEQRFHKLRPTLIGSQYYQVTINEIVLEKGAKKATVIVRDEVGNQIAEEEVDISKLADHYFTEVKDNGLNEYKERTATLIIKNDSGEVIQKLDISPEVQAYYDALQSNIIEEIVGKNGKKNISVINKDKKKRVLEEILEEDPA